MIASMLPRTSPITASTYHTVTVEGLEIFYREAGDPAKPTILLLHGFPSSSHMYRNLMQDLASDYHLIAPDYPGFGCSSSPSVSDFEYTFDHLSDIMEGFIDRLKLSHFVLFIQDYGAPVGFRIMSRRPELIQGLIVQNANTYTEGLGPDVEEIGALQGPGDEERLDAAIRYKISLEGIKDQYLFGAGHPEKIPPESYMMDYYLVQPEEKQQIQMALFKNYGTNFPKYPEWQSYLREHQPPTLIVWGENDRIFTGAGALAYKRDVKNAEVHLLPGGHFVLEEYHQETANLIDHFMKNKVVKSASK